MTPKRGLFLVNLGSPDSPSVPHVRRYLDQFLNDPYVIDIPWVFRKLLVNGIILNTRPKKSAHAYSKIWTEQGSPLLTHSRELTKKVSEKLTGIPVVLGMRYGNPSIDQGLQQFKDQGITDLKIIPLYPQLAYASTESVRAEILRVLEKMNYQPRLEWVNDFYDHPRFIGAVAAKIKPVWEQKKPDALLLTYHGIPERHLTKPELKNEGCLVGNTCCDTITDKNRNCYRAQCYATSRALTQALGLQPHQVITSFQSRLGRTPWIKPYTDFVLKDLPVKGVKRLIAASPSFVADCLETLEEINMTYRESFLEGGGADFEYVECVNSSDEFVNTIATL